MTITFLTDGNNDLFLANGRLATATGVDAVAQCCTNAVKTLLGECVLDTERGMPNFKLIWGGSPNLKLYEAALRKTLLAVDGVDQVVSVDISLN